MADKTMLSFEVDEALGAHVTRTIEHGPYESVGEYMRDLIRHDQDHAFDLGNIDILREAFAVPDSMCTPFDPAAFRAEMQQRHG